MDSNALALTWEIVCKGLDWIQPAQDTGQWQALVNTVMNLCFSVYIFLFITVFLKLDLHTPSISSHSYPC